MLTSKSLNYLDNQSTHPAKADEALEKEYFLVGAIFDVSDKGKNNNQQINTIAADTSAEWSITFNTNGTNICYKNNFGAQINVIPDNQIETQQTKPRITKSMTTLSTYNGSNIPVKGQRTLDIQHPGKNVLFHHQTEIEQTIKPYQENTVNFQCSKA